MDLFETPTWDVGNASETLNIALFSSGSKKRKVQFENETKNSKKIAIKKSTGSPRDVVSTKRAFISKFNERFEKIKQGQANDKNGLSVLDKRSLKNKRKKKIIQVGLDLNNSSQKVLTPNTPMHMTEENKQATFPKGKKVFQANDLDVSTKKNKNMLGNLNKFGATGLSKLKSKQKGKFVLSVSGKVNEKVENYRPLKSSKLLSAKGQPTQPKKIDSLITGQTSKLKTITKKRKQKKQTTLASEENCKQSSQVNGVQKEVNETANVNGTISSSNKIDKNKHHKINKIKFEPLNSPSGNKFIQKDLKILTRRQPGTLRERMMRRLQSSRFRYLNEQMYCSKGDEAFEYFKTDPQAFQAYHHGYRQQVAKWPLNPLTTIISSLKKKSSDLVIADFGCGDAQLSRSLPNKVHSFDLVAVSDEVTVCDMAHTPLPKSSVDVAVFCLSLMGTNLTDYLIEANRILKEGGIMKIAEVESRFENVSDFTKTLVKYGFTMVRQDLSHNLFYFMDFKKVDKIKKNKRSLCPPVTLKPCLYKKR